MQVIGDQLFVPHDYLGSTLKPHAETHINWQACSETVFTNDRGWRVANKRDVAGPRKVAVAGCSWAQGIGLNYNESLVGLLEEALGLEIANFGVGSYSLLQAIRRSELEIPVAKPDTLFIIFGDWLIDRCIKDNAHSGIIYRPIVKRKSNSSDLVIVEPRALPEELLALGYEIEMKRNQKPITAYEYNQKHVLAIWAMIVNGFATSYLLKKLGLRKLERIDLRDSDLRSAILELCLDKLQTMCVEAQITAVLAHVDSPRMLADETYGKLGEIESKRLSEIARNYDRVQIVERNFVFDEFQEYFTNSSTPPSDWQSVLRFPDHNHLNADGTRLVADGIIKGLKSKNII